MPTSILDRRALEEHLKASTQSLFISNSAQESQLVAVILLLQSKPLAGSDCSIYWFRDIKMV
jgi:hypothetical protein